MPFGTIVNSYVLPLLRVKIKTWKFTLNQKNFIKFKILSFYLFYLKSFTFHTKMVILVAMLTIGPSKSQNA